MQNHRQHVAALVVASQKIARAAAVEPGGRAEGLVEIEPGGIERVLRRYPGRGERGADASERHQRRGDGDRGPAEAPGEIVLAQTQPGEAKDQSALVKRASGRSSARCTVETLFFMAQGRSWWCSGT